MVTISRTVHARLLLSVFVVLIAVSGAGSAHTKPNHEVIGSGPASFVSRLGVEKKANLTIAVDNDRGVVKIGNSVASINCRVSSSSSSYNHVFVYSTATVPLTGVQLRVYLTIVDKRYAGYAKGTAIAIVVEHGAVGPCGLWTDNYWNHKLSHALSTNRFFHVP